MEREPLENLSFFPQIIIEYFVSYIWAFGKVFFSAAVVLQNRSGLLWLSNNQNWIIQPNRKTLMTRAQGQNAVGWYQLYQDLNY